LLPVAGVWCLLYFLISDQPSRFWMVLPFAILFAALGYLRFKYRRSTGRSAVKRQEHGFTFYSNIVIGAVAAGYFVWARRVGLDTAHVAGGLCLMLGIGGVLMAFQARGRLYYLGSSIPVMLFGVSMLIWTTRDAIVVIACMTLIVAGLASGAIQVYQLKRSEMRNDTD